MPTFCRHNRLVANCPICAREQHVELRPVVSPGGRPAPTEPRTARPAQSAAGARSRGGSRPTGRAGGVTVRRLAREANDDYRSALVPGVKSGADARRLAEEIAFAATRLERLAADPPGLYAEVADPAVDVEERIWLAFEIAFLGPLDSLDSNAADDGDPFASIAAVRRSWASGEPPALADATPGPRSGIGADPARAGRVVDAYRAWAQRAGSQAAGIHGDDAWTPGRRFDRVYERLGSLDRALRYDLLVTLGRLGLEELDAESLHLGGSDRVTLAAKRILGIGDPLLLQRRAAELAEACAVPLAALDLGFDNWERRTRSTMGLAADVEPDGELVAGVRRALGAD